jgi:hypothetical protein
MVLVGAPFRIEARMKVSGSFLYRSHCNISRQMGVDRPAQFNGRVEPLQVESDHLA